MKIKKIVVGELQTNCYLLFKNNQSLIIDPGDDGDKISQLIGNKKVEGILITHSHFDHIGAVSFLQEKYQCLVYSKNNLKEQRYQINSFHFEVIFTPGHTSDSLSYFFDNQYLFTGDLLFKGTVGRCDLPTGDFKTLMNSLDKIKKYPLSTKIYPGHGEETRLEEELKYNSYLNC